VKIKVGPFSRKVRRQYTGIVAVLSAVASFYFIAVKVSDKQRTAYLIWATTTLIGLYLAVWLRANFKRSTKLSINGSALVVKVGDIFKQRGLKAVAFNEYFDTVANDVLISKSSLNGKYLLKLSPQKLRSLDKRIASDSRLKDRVQAQNTARQTGKKTSYKLGSIFVDDEYLLVAFSRFNQHNQAELTLKEYVTCMVNFWDEVDQVYAGRSVSLPLMGAGITRFKDAEVQPQELLNILIWTFKISRVKFKHPANATMIIHSSMADKINLYDLDN
jgi:hypothetical protein